MARGSALQRALQFFREENLDVVRVAYTLAGEIVSARLEKAVKQANGQSLAASAPRKRRSRKDTISQETRELAMHELATGPLHPTTLRKLSESQ